MTPLWIDHAIVLLIAIAFPIWEFFLIRGTARSIGTGEVGLRMGFYRRVIREEWIVALALVALWFGLGRGAGELGLVPHWNALAWGGYALAAAVCIVLVLQARGVMRSVEGRETLRKQMGWLLNLMPHTGSELRAFDRVSITAGICEELIFRGFLTAYFGAAFGLPLWGAILASSVAFGFAHIYQGPQGVVRVTLFGLVLGLLYGMTGSIWAPVVAHGVMDMASGRMSHAVASDADPQDTDSPMAA